METTVSVNRISHITKDKDGNVLDLFVFHLANGKPNLIRRGKQFLTDLSGSFLIDDRINNTRHPEVRDALEDLQAKPFTITGNIKYCKKGDLWVVREESTVVTDPNNPRYNTVVPGDKLPYETDMTIVEDGFLTVRVNPLVKAMNKDSIAKAKLYMAMLYDDAEPVAKANTTQDNSEFDANDIDSDVLKHALGINAGTAVDNTTASAKPEVTEEAEEAETAKAGKK
jgi:hypothetical protein